MNLNINWNPPAPRKGKAGLIDRFFGPGYTEGEKWIALFFATAFAMALLVFGLVKKYEWSWIQYVVAVLLMFDISGGVITNATNAAKRWYHREKSSVILKILFILLHGVHIYLVTRFFYEMNWWYFGVLYGYLFLTSLIILTFPLYLQRPLAMLFYLGALLIGFYVYPPVTGMEWFVPLFFLKLQVCHILKEAPFRPASEMESSTPEDVVYAEEEAEVQTAPHDQEQNI